MLVLSRRLNEAISFPAQNITIEVLQIKGSLVKLGINAPRDVQILRQELDGLPKTSLPGAHASSNLLARLTTDLQGVQKLLDTGKADEAQAILANVLKQIPGRESAPSKKPARTPGRCRTLVVDDDQNDRELLAGILHMNGCDCVTAPDGQAALDYLASHERPDFILLDMWMPRCDGRQALGQIRGNPRYEGTKVFAISGSSPQDVGIADGTGGFDAWFSKPLDPADLWDAMRKSLPPQPPEGADSRI